jgi:hypothetical protein
MNIKQINEWRLAHGLVALVPPAKNRSQAANQAKRAQECRDLKAKRNKGGK